MDILLLLLQLIRIGIWLAILAPALILVSKFLFFFSNGKQWRPVSMTPGHRQWKKSILTGGALCAAWWPFPPFIWNSNTSLGLNLFILIWTIPLGLNVTSAIPLHLQLQCGTWESLYVVRSRHFLCTFFCCREF